MCARQAWSVRPRPPVLVVEDDHDVRVTLRGVLEDEGYEVMTAANGKDALALLEHADPKPALILLDLMMPIMDGWQLVETLRAQELFAAIPFIVHSAFVDLGLPDGASAVLRKPIDVDNVVALVNKHCV